MIVMIIDHLLMPLGKFLETGSPIKAGSGFSVVSRDTDMWPGIVIKPQVEPTLGFVDYCTRAQLEGERNRKNRELSLFKCQMYL